ncbi:GNAT family N-acetyltransferase [Kitasatospora sp. NPDC096077]|uniref:GNAT family N-acetyltransferase n=1 Tax=Kitasatospora sp. NPDC096077 TaxID=3155544 RepID=UPI003325037F
MTWTFSTSLDEFRARTGRFLAARPAENTVLLTIAHRLAEAGLDVFGQRPPVFGWWQAEPGGPIGGAFLRTPPYAHRLSCMPEAAAAELAARLATAEGEFAEVTGVGGEAGVVRAFAAAWTAATGAVRVDSVEERLYRLGELASPPRPPRPPAGRHRLAEAADRELLIRWYQEFAAEARVPELADVARVVDDRIAARGLHLWEDGGRPVAMAGASPVLAGMSRIGPVYTPRENRGRGYASGVTAAASAHALGLGAAEALLYTDLANPTSNSIYQQIGYRPVEDCLVLDFREGEEG